MPVDERYGAGYTHDVCRRPWLPITEGLNAEEMVVAARDIAASRLLKGRGREEAVTTGATQ